MRRRLAWAVPTALVSLVVSPGLAEAHGLVGRTDLPIPTWLFGWAAAVVLIVSFVALGSLWRSPRLEAPAVHPLPAIVSRAITSRLAEVGCGAVGVALLVLVVVAGLAGDQVETFNFAPQFVFVNFWVGLVAASVLFGDVFRAFNPWRAVGRVVGSLWRRAGWSPISYPAWLGRWPAALGLLAFVWLEIVKSEGSRPQTVAVAACVYSVLTWSGMASFGVEAWSSRAEAFGVYFNLFSRVSVFERREGKIVLRPFLGGLGRLEVLPGTVPLLMVMIGTVSFDGASGGPVWQSVVPTLQDGFASLPGVTLEWTFGFGLLAMVLLVGAFYRLGIAGARSVDRSRASGDLARAFAPSLVPIAFAYVAAHYVSLLLLQGQAVAGLISDPLGRGWNVFGTATWKVDYTLLGAETFWYLQVGLVITGHIAALIVAHDRALVLYPDARSAVRSQYFMLTVMVGFTSLALWLLSQVNLG